MSIWNIFLPQRQRAGPANAAKGEVTCPACSRVRHISDISSAAEKNRKGIGQAGGCRTCGGRNWTLGIYRSGSGS